MKSIVGLTPSPLTGRLVSETWLPFLQMLGMGMPLKGRTEGGDCVLEDCEFCLKAFCICPVFITYSYCFMRYLFIRT